METQRDALVQYLILKTVLEQYEQGERVFCLGQLLLDLGLTPDDKDWDTLFEITDKLLAHKDDVLAGLEAHATASVH